MTMSNDPTTTAEQGAAVAATPEPPKPAAPTAATEANGQRDAADAPLGEPGLKALQKERAERERLERELQPLKEQMQKLAGIFGDKAADPGKDIVTTLQDQVTKMQRESLVDRVARRHGITEDGDVDFLRTASDEATMQRLAERLKANPSNSTPSAPAPDPSQGSAPLTPEAAADAEYKAFFPETSK